MFQNYRCLNTPEKYVARGELFLEKEIFLKGCKKDDHDVVPSSPAINTWEKSSNERSLLKLIYPKLSAAEKSKRTL